MKKLNYEFALKDFNKTKENHISKIKKVKKLIRYEDIMGLNDREAENLIPYYIQNNSYYLYNTKDNQSRWSDKTKQSVIKELKTIVNYNTRNFIQKQLEDNNFPKSWDTAFYITYFNRVNRLMKRLIKQKFI